MNLNFEKYADGLIPAIVQDARTRAVLMLGYMNRAALEATTRTGIVTFFSRSRQELWVKGETSGNFLKLVSMSEDCDSDAVLVLANPTGPSCHTGATTCFGEPENDTLAALENVIEDRRAKPTEDSYVSKLFAKGINKIAQKVGEEAVETVIAAKDDDNIAFVNESADLLFHHLILLNAKGTSLKDVLTVLENRMVTVNHGNFQSNTHDRFG